jgi:hypothetical protein
MKNLTIHILILCLGSGMLYAQTEQMVVPGDLKQQTIITEPITLRKGFLRVGIEGAFIIVDKVFDENGNRSYVLGTNAWGKFSGYQLAIHYGITDRLEIGCKVPYLNQKYYVSTVITSVIDRKDTLISFRTRGRGLGDVEAGIKYQVVRETERLPGLMIGTVLTLPTGRKNPRNIINDLEYDHPTGDGIFEWETYAILKKVFYPFSSTTRIHYKHYFPGKKIFFPDEPETEFNMGDYYNIASDFGVQLNDWISLSNELGFNTAGENTYYYDPVETSPSAWTVDYVPSLFFQIRRFRFVQAISIPLFGKYNSADPTYIFGLSYIF